VLFSIGVTRIVVIFFFFFQLLFFFVNELCFIIGVHCRVSSGGSLSPSETTSSRIDWSAKDLFLVEYLEFESHLWFLPVQLLLGILLRSGR